MAGSAGTIRAGSPATAAAALRGAENADGRLHFGIVQHVVGRRERRDAVQGEMHLQVAARCDPGERLADIGRQRVRPSADRDVGDRRDDNGRDHVEPFSTWDTGDPAIGDQNRPPYFATAVALRAR